MMQINAQQIEWVESTLESLTLEQRIGQLMLPPIFDENEAERLIGLMDDIPLGGVFVWNAEPETHRRRIRRFQEAGSVPLVVAADLENGPGYVIQGTAQFPDSLAVAAANDEELAYLMAKAGALYGRWLGIHWTFAPVVDINMNPNNPIANTRSLGDDPEKIIRLAKAIIRGFQEHGVAACPKHFPGDGVDDLDQHSTTPVNHLDLDHWKNTFGRVFNAAYEAGAWSTMAGHIALPAWDHYVDERHAPRPATVSHSILTELSRTQMGFDGVIVSDDMNMGGVSNYMPRKQRQVECIKAGCDVVLFPKLPEDYETVLAAARNGDLSEGRIAEAARRVLTLKARLGLHTGELTGPEPTEEEKRIFQEASDQMAKQAITCVRNQDRLLPLKNLKPGSKVLTVTLHAEVPDLPCVDEELRRRGYGVQHLVNPQGSDIRGPACEADAVFINFAYRATWGIGSPRLVGTHGRLFMSGIVSDHPRIIYTSFGSPYHLRDFPTFRNYINAYSCSPESQRAVVAAWFGELPMDAESPVQNLLRKPHSR